MKITKSELNLLAALEEQDGRTEKPLDGHYSMATRGYIRIVTEVTMFNTRTGFYLIQLTEAGLLTLLDKKGQ